MEFVTKYPVLYVGEDINMWAPIEENAQMIKEELEKLLNKTGEEKVNIIAFSMCGLAARMLASSMGYGDKIASVTTVCTPHYGLRTVDKLINARVKKLSSAYLVMKNWEKVMGENSKEFEAAIYSLGTENMRAFNLLNPNSDGIFYQSCACAVSPEKDVGLSSANNILSVYDGENDGFASVYSAMWGQHSIVYRNVSHLGVTREIYDDLISVLIKRAL